MGDMESKAVGVVLLLLYLGMPMPIVAVTSLVVLNGDPTELRCSGSNRNWRHTPSHQGIEKEIYYDGELQPGFSGDGFSILSNETLGELILSIERVAINMSGKYECWSGFNTIHASIELIVLETILDCRATSVSADRKAQRPYYSPSNDCRESTSCSSSHTPLLNTAVDGLPKNEFIGPNTCGIDPDQILLVCEATYFGNGTPVLELINMKNKKVVVTLCSETVPDANMSRKIFTCKATVNATKDLDGAQFICQTKNQATQSSYNFTTPPLTILYAINGYLSNSRTVERGQLLNCTADCNQPCGHRWTWSKTPGIGGEQDVECSANWVSKKTGHYRCEATCLIGENRCDVIAMDVTSIEPNKYVDYPKTTALWEQSGLNVTSTVIGVAALAVAVLAIVLTCIVRRRKSRAQVPNQSNQDDIEMQPSLSGSGPNENR